MGSNLNGSSSFSVFIFKLFYYKMKCYCCRKYIDHNIVLKLCTDELCNYPRGGGGIGQAETLKFDQYLFFSLPGSYTSCSYSIKLRKMSLQTSSVPLRIHKTDLGKSSGPIRGQTRAQVSSRALIGGLESGVVLQNRIEPVNVRYSSFFHVLVLENPICSFLSFIF